MNGLVVHTETGYRDQTLTTSDPRMTGTRTVLDNSYQSLQASGTEPARQ